MLAHIRVLLERDASILADALETTFGSPKKIEVYEEQDGYGIRLSWRRMGFGSDKTYLVTLTLDDGGL
jgi:hypothetical protein